MIAAILNSMKTNKMKFQVGQLVKVAFGDGSVLVAPCVRCTATEVFLRSSARKNARVRSYYLGQSIFGGGIEAASATDKVGFVQADY
jgi:hypothetical protein